MVEKTYLFLEFVGEIFEVKFFDDVLLLDPFNVKKVVFTVGQHLSGVIEINSNHVVTQSIPNPVLR